MSHKVQLDDTTHNIDINGFELGCFNYYEFNESVELLLTPSQYKKFLAEDTARIFRASQKRVKACTGFLKGVDNDWFPTDKPLLFAQRSEEIDRLMKSKPKIEQSRPRKRRQPKPNIDRWTLEIPLQDIVSPDYDETANLNPCVCCGKLIKKEKYFVQLLENGNLVSSSTMVAESQGFFPIGNTCKNKLPNNFYF